MAKKSKTSTRSLTGPRVLERAVPEYIGTYVDGQGFPSYKTWTTNAAGNAIMHESYFDLAGYTRDYLTLVPSGASIQDLGYYTTSGTSPGTALIVLDIISQERLELQAVVDDWADTANVPGHPTSTEDFEQIIYGRFQWLAPTLDFTFTTALTPVSRGNFGSGSPTTVEKLWCYRILMPQSIDLTDDRIVVSSSRFVLGATIIKEDELPFLMRQKRSYELGTGR